MGHPAKTYSGKNNAETKTKAEGKATAMATAMATAKDKGLRVV